MSLATSMTPGTTGWIVTLDCGHTRHLHGYPDCCSAIRCDTCEPHGTEIRRTRLPGSPLWPGEVVRGAENNETATRQTGLATGTCPRPIASSTADPHALKAGLTLAEHYVAEDRAEDLSGKASEALLWAIRETLQSVKEKK